MSAGADEIKIADALGPVVEAEPGRLAKQRCDRKPRTVGAQVVAAKVLGRHGEVARDAVAEARQDRLVECRDDACLQARPFNGPIDRALQVGHGAQHIEAVAAGWREAGVGGRGSVQVEGKILRQNLVVKDVGQQLAIPLAEPDGVVRDVRVLTGRAEVQDEQAHRKLGRRKLQSG